MVCIYTYCRCFWHMEGRYQVVSNKHTARERAEHTRPVSKETTTSRRKEQACSAGEQLYNDKRYLPRQVGTYRDLHIPAWGTNPSQNGRFY